MAQDLCVAKILPTLVEKQLFTDSIPSIDIFDLDYFESRIEELQVAFHEDFCFHTLALKANPIRGVIQFAVKKGLGAETASVSETLHALSLNLKPHQVIFGSPCKTKADLELVIKQGVQVNLDNEHEIKLVDELLKTTCPWSGSSFGVRLNPVVGGGLLGMTSTATRASKFGLPITPETRNKVMDLYVKYEWLSAVHIHVGSQGIPLQKFVDGARVCMDFVLELKRNHGINIKTINIGGGLSSSYTEPEEPAGFSFSDYRQLLDKQVPELFSGKYKIVTEFGRSLLLKAGTTLSKVEYVKKWLTEVTPIVLTHVGSNQFYTEVYLPDIRKHRFDLADKTGMLRTCPKKMFDIAGPLCFQGDYLAKQVELPTSLEIGDILIIHDTGAYTMSMYSKFNSNIPSPVYGFSLKNSQIFCFKERETITECLAFWGSKHPRFV